MGGDVGGLIAAAGGRDGEIGSAVEAIGVERAAGMVVDEIVGRFYGPPVESGGETVVQLSFGYGGSSVSYVLRVGAGGVGHELGAVEEPDAAIEQELCEAVRAVFGPGGIGRAATRRLRLRGAELPQTYLRPPPAFWVAQRVLATMDERDAVGLAELASRYGSDKWGIHRYTQHYQRHFEPFRQRSLTVLEIGVGGLSDGTSGDRDPANGGASLRMWKHYFPRARVYGIDIVDKRAQSEQRITVLRADQSDPADLERSVRETGPLDIVIDDGSHRSAHVLTSFVTLFPHLRADGLYVIEDLQTSYWPRFGGNSQALDSQVTSVGFLKSLVDGLNYEEIGDRAPGMFDDAITGLHFYHNIAFIEKGRNAEGGGPAWLRFPPQPQP